MDMTPLRRTVLVMILVAIPWFIIVLSSWVFLLRAHQESEQPMDWFWMRVAIVAGGVLCIAALKVFSDGVREKQNNFLLNIFALAAFWYLIEWPAKAVLAILGL
jgi:hypothetical protein